MLKENLEKIYSEIKSGNNLGEEITLVGATKTMPYQTINDALDLGLKVIAENNAYEFRNKKDFVKGGTWHFIGHLQTNKVKFVVGSTALIHSVDSVRLANAISETAIKKGVVQDVLLEVNISKEESKSGFFPEDLDSAISEITALNGVKIKGLMTMLPLGCEKEKAENYFNNMRSIYDDYKRKGLPFTYLSMGMSGDYLTAIKHGSNMIRLGTAIFGKRNYGEK